MHNKPFLYLLENIDKLDIDPRLIPTFSEVLKLMEQYFEDNDLLDCMDFKTFFDKYFINDSKYKIKLIIKSRNQNDFFSCYIAEKKEIRMNEDEYDIHKLCHEFIHAMVWKSKEDAKEKFDVGNSETFLDEGATESLARKISNYKPANTTNTYNENVEFSHFLENLYGEKEFYKLFFSGKSLEKTFMKDDEAAKVYLVVLCMIKDYHLRQKFYQDNPRFNIKNNDNLYNEFEIELINIVLQNYYPKIDTFEDLINATKIIASRPRECSGKIDYIYYRLINNYLDSINLNFAIKFDLNQKIKNVLSNYDKVYTYGPDDYACVELKNQDGAESIKVYIDKNYAPIKADLEVNPCMIGYVAYENSNDDNRKRYATVDYKKSNIDFTKEKKYDEQLVQSNLLKLFSHNDEFTRLVINELLAKYCNTSLDEITTADIDQLKNNIDPLLYSVISEQIFEKLKGRSL